jgi:hypothetical protein
METVNKVKKVRGRPFTPGDPRIRAGPGRPPLPPEVRELRRKAIKDVREELRGYLGVAVNALIEVADDPDAPESARVSAASEIISRVVGKPGQPITAEVSFDKTDRLTPEQIRAAALVALGGSTT